MVDEPRNATCVAATDVETLVLGKADFRQALQHSPSFRDQVQSIYFRRQ
jgi:CRP-like cAMP-binding protein